MNIITNLLGAPLLAGVVLMVFGLTGCGPRELSDAEIDRIAEKLRPSYEERVNELVLAQVAVIVEDPQFLAQMDKILDEAIDDLMEDPEYQDYVDGILGEVMGTKEFCAQAILQTVVMMNDYTALPTEEEKEAVCAWYVENTKAE